MESKKVPFKLKALLQEVLFYSGQFALFYLLMQIIIEGVHILQNKSHVGLLIALIVQTLILSRSGNSISQRLVFSFLAPAVYSVLELQEGADYALNAAHIGFWIHAALSGVLTTLKLNGNSRISRISETLLVLVNVAIFLFLYFYFDTWKDGRSKAELTIVNIFQYSSNFLNDPTHWFVIAGGTFLALTIALGRHEVILLKERIHALFGKYVDGKIRDLIIEEGTIQARRLELCIIFSDIKNFTHLCEHNDPVLITDMLNMYFEQWNAVVEKHGGIVDKYIGDAIMIIFGLSSGRSACDAPYHAVLKWMRFGNNYKASFANIIYRFRQISALAATMVMLFWVTSGVVIGKISR